MMSFETGAPPELGSLLDGFPRELFSDRFFRLCELCERYGLELAVSQFHALGLGAGLQVPQTTPELLAALRLRPRFEPALGWILRRLAAAGLLEICAEDGRARYRLDGELRGDDREAVRAAALGTDSGSRATFDLLDAAAEIYPALARGEASGEELLFEDPSKISIWLGYFDNANALYAVNNHVAAHAAAARLAGAGRLRILEIGSGAGSASLALAEVLDTSGLLDRVRHYTVSEPNAFFRRRAERAFKTCFAETPARFLPLDIDRSWTDQLDDAEPRDLVYGVNVMHLAKDLVNGLRQARLALAPGGWLVLGECVRPAECEALWAEFVFQVLDGFQNVRTSPVIRPRPGFMTVASWRAAFERAGFERVEVSPDVEAIWPRYPRFFTAALCARRPA